MQRLVEQPAAEGDLLEEGVYLGRVHYHLAVYQHFADEEGGPVPTNLEVEGRVTPLEALDLAALHATGIELTLRLADGRWLDFGFWTGTGRSVRPAEGCTRRGSRASFQCPVGSPSRPSHTTIRRIPSRTVAEDFAGEGQFSQGCLVRMRPSFTWNHF